MLLTHLNTPELRPQLDPPIRRVDPAAVLDDRWEAFLTRWPEATCLVVACGGPDPELRRRLESARFARPVLPLVLVTPTTPEALACFSTISIDQVLDLGRVRTDLMPVLTDWLRRGCLARIMTRIESAAIPEDLRTALVGICAADPPYTEVKDLEDRLCLDRRRIAEHLARTKAGALGITLRDALAAVFLIHACRLHGRRGSWERTASTLGVDHRTLKAWSRRVLGMRPSEINSLGPTGAVRRIVERVPDPSDRAGMID